MTDDELATLATEIRELLITSVASNGGHLGPNLGVVELTIALHRVFDSPARPRHLGHRPPGLRAQDADRSRRRLRHAAAARAACRAIRAAAESEHDWVENSHASTSLSYADGMAKAFRCAARTDHVVAVIGDGALTGGMAWEALNNIAADKRPPAGDRGQRQRPLLHARPSAGSPTTHRDPHQPALRAGPRRDQGAAQPHALRRARRPTTPCTRSRRASRTRSRRRACSRTSA